MTEVHDVAAPLASRTFYIAVGTLMAVEVMSSLESSMIYTALPTIAREFGNPHLAGWLVTGFLLIQAGTAAIGGRLGDIFGRKKILAIIVALCALGSLISALSPGLGLMIVGRSIQGLSGAILPLCYGIIRQSTTPDRSPFWIGCLTGAWAFAAAFGYVIAGYLSDIGSWRSIFWFTAIYGAIVIPPLLLWVPETLKSVIHQRLDIFGGLLFVPAIGSVLYGITLGGSVGWGSPLCHGFILGGAALLTFWAWWESRQVEPLIDVRLLCRREIFLGNVSGALVGLGVLQLPLVMMMLLQQPVGFGIGLGVGAMLAGLLKLPSNVGALVAAPFSGAISGKIGSRWAVFTGAMVAVGGWVSLFFFHDTLLTAVSGTVIAAFGSTMLLAALPNLVLEGAPIERSSEVTGLSGVVRAVFSAVGAQVIVTILASSRVGQADGPDYPSEAAYLSAFAYVALTALATAAVSLAIRRRGSPARRPLPERTASAR